MIILAVESSCDETSVAISKNGKEILSNQVLSQINIHQAFGGVVPEVAARNHIIHMTRLFENALTEANLTPRDIDLVAVTYGPGLIGSLLVGINAAQSFAMAHNIELIAVNHLIGHIYAAQIESEIIFPSLALLISGGHTELILLKDHFDFTVLGSTLDDAVGEAYDKVAKILGLAYPGGPIVDQLAHLGKPTYSLPIPLSKDQTYNFSFSGLKSAVMNLVNKTKMKNEELRINDVCASFQEVCVKTLYDKTYNAIKEYQPKQLIIGGGVAANKGIRAQFRQENLKLPVVFAPFEYCTDQAAMIAIAAYYQYQKEGALKKYSLKASPTLSI